jgi:hypothetical protein
LLKVNPIHGKTRVRSDFYAIARRETLFEFACTDGIGNECNQIRVLGIQMGIKRIVNRMGSEDLVVERDGGAVPEQTGAW